MFLRREKMAVYRIAELNIKIDPLFHQTERRLEPYRADAEFADFEINLTPDDFDEYISSLAQACQEDSAESTLILTKICKTVLSCYDGFFFHSSCLALDGEGYVFSAPSGTGKSTHTRLWREYFGSRVTMINDDKPIVRRVNGEFRIFGTPWMGKSEIGSNTSAPIKAVYLLEQSKENHIEQVSAGRALGELLEATLLPRDRADMVRLLGLFDELFSEIPLFKLSCNMDVSAVRLAYGAANISEGAV